MKVKELIEELSNMDPEAVVVLQRDSEGNGYFPAAGVEEAIYAPSKTGYSGEVVHKDDLEEMSSTELSKLEKAAVLWPVN